MAAKQLLSTTEAAKILGISRIAVFKKIRQGRMAATMFGGSYAINSAALAIEKKKMKRRDELRKLRRRK